MQTYDKGSQPWKLLNTVKFSKIKYSLVRNIYAYDLQYISSKTGKLYVASKYCQFDHISNPNLGSKSPVPTINNTLS